MKKEELMVLYDKVDTDWIEENPYEAYLLFNELVREHMFLMDRLQLANEGLDLAQKLIGNLKRMEK